MHTSPMAYEHMTSTTGMATMRDERSAVGVLAPGFRFHPTDEELILHYLRNRVASLPCPAAIITELDIYKFNPWDLPGRAVFGEKEWYFFTPRERKYPNGVRPNRAAGSGYWKATGIDKLIVGTGRRVSIGVKKALVFYVGKPPKGAKTGWIMHEYRLAGVHAAAARPVPSPKFSMRLDDWVLCRIYQKNSSPSDRREELPSMEVYASPPSANITQGTSPVAQDFDSHALARIPHGGDPAGDADLLSMTMMGQDTLGADDGFGMWQRMLEGCSAAMDEGEEMVHAYGFHPGFSGRAFEL